MPRRDGSPGRGTSHSVRDCSPGGCATPQAHLHHVGVPTAPPPLPARSVHGLFRRSDSSGTEERLAEVHSLLSRDEGCRRSCRPFLAAATGCCLWEAGSQAPSCRYHLLRRLPLTMHVLLLLSKINSPQERVHSVSLMSLSVLALILRYL